MMMLACYVESIGLTTNGMEGWSEAREILQQLKHYEARELPRYKPKSLPPNERRRATSMIRLAFSAAEEATEVIDCNPAEMSSVFASSGGDYQIVNQICQELCTEAKQISPSQFHNSVHNSAAGYWGIGVSSQKPSISLSAYDWSFAVGLLEALMLLEDGASKVLYLCYDDAVVSPLNARRNIDQPFSVAMVLSAEKSSNTMFKISMEQLGVELSESQCSDAALETLRLANPAARCLPLLSLAANKSSDTINLPLSEDRCVSLKVEHA